MKLQGFIAEVGQPTFGTSQATGKEWACRPLSLLVPFHTERGEEKYDNIVADYFGDADDGLLNSYVQQRQLMHFTVSFTTRTHNGRRYQSARVFNLAAVV